MEEEVDKYIRDIQKNEKDVKTAIVAANNHYAGFGPMTVRLSAEMMNLQNYIRVISYCRLQNTF